MITPKQYLDRMGYGRGTNYGYNTVSMLIQSYIDKYFPKWILASQGLPPAEIPVIAYGLNKQGKPRRIRAFYAPRWTIEDGNEHEGAEYSEEKDQYYLREGWYESNEFEDVHWFVDFDITHWMPLPEVPEIIV